MFRRLSPLTLLTAAAVTMVLALVVNHWVFSLAVIAGLLLPGLVWSGQGGRIAAAAALLVLPMTVSLLLMHALFFPEGRQVLAQWGILRVTAEGLLFGISMSLRLAVLVLAFLIFSYTLSVSDLMAELNRRRWHPKLVFVVCSALQFAPIVSERAAQISEAQQARGLVLRRGLSSRLRAFLMLAVPLVLGLLVDVEERARALESRGFSRPGPRTSYAETVDSAGQKAFRLAAVGFTGLFTAYWYGRGVWL